MFFCQRPGPERRVCGPGAEREEGKNLTHDINYLRLLAEKFPTIESVTNEIVNLRAIMHLPKGTEYYFSDLHGEHEAFIHLLRSGSGVIREKIDSLFRSSMMEEDRSALAALVYYPSTQLARARKTEQNYDDWCAITINHLVVVACEVSAKYTRSKVRRTIDPRYAGIIEDEHRQHGRRQAHLLSGDDRRGRERRLRQRPNQGAVPPDPADDRRPAAHHRRYL